MNKTRSTGNTDAVLLDRKTLYEYLNAGRQTAERIVEEAGAVRTVVFLCQGREICSKTEICIV